MCLQQWWVNHQSSMWWFSDKMRNPSKGTVSSWPFPSSSHCDFRWWLVITFQMFYVSLKPHPFQRVPALPTKCPDRSSGESSNSPGCETKAARQRSPQALGTCRKRGDPKGNDFRMRSFKNNFDFVSSKNMNITKNHRMSMDFLHFFLWNCWNLSLLRNELNDASLMAPEWHPDTSKVQVLPRITDDLSDRRQATHVFLQPAKLWPNASQPIISILQKQKIHLSQGHHPAIMISNIEPSKSSKRRIKIWDCLNLAISCRPRMQFHGKWRFMLGIPGD